MDSEALARLEAGVHHGSRDDPELLDFSANTNPRVPEGTERVYGRALAAAGSYPDDGYPEYRHAAAEAVDCAPGDVVPTPGGLAAIRLAVAAAVSPGDTALVPAPSFAEYAREVRLQGGEPVFRPHDKLPDADPEGHALAVVCTPNNPTGEAYATERLRAFADRCREVGTVPLVDEAFLGFTDRPSLAGREGVVVARSLTKLYGLPGLRAGYAVATGDLGDRLRTARPTWALGTPAAAVGAHCMRQREFVAATRERVREERVRMRERLSARFEVHPSDAPFLLLAVPDVEAIQREVEAAEIAVRDARTFRDLDSHVRVAVRTPAENDRLLEALDV
ncbi:aminotransferase class I/II-fold pyridoxal phosphate-dependent enzyme [Salinirussus salinus]|uniref:aminotransferase class I/II-fold pyridoxal phosphate-dependent enzyme n=1 Tax=Salinirussus salinus TaxID=1198300 RepID=UPI001359AD7D|nr:aminotransferase class I/II-fold pyridoxal phosphate-dependent enzyme [Salinirussus salinus]